MTAQIPEQLLAYFADRDAQRVAERDDFLARLTPRERALMREAAVLAYVHGRQQPLGDGEHPKDSRVFAGVIDSALRMPDLYPAINHVAGRIDLETCIDPDGRGHAEHDYPPPGQGDECRRCGAQAETEENADA